MISYNPVPTALDTIWELEKTSRDIKNAMKNLNHDDYIKFSVEHLMARALAEIELPSQEANEITLLYNERYKNLTKNMPWRNKNAII